MSDFVDVFWSFRSPYSRLVVPDLLKLRDDFHVTVRLRPVLPLAIRFPQSLFDPNDKRAPKYIVRDSMRRGQMLGRPVVYPLQPDPVVQDFTTMKVSDHQPHIHRLTKLGVEATRQGKGLEFAGHVSAMIFGGTQGWDKGSIFSQTVEEIGLDLAALDNAIEGGDHAEDIESNHKALDASGHWGVPTMVFRDEPLFGQDRVDTLRWRLENAGLAR
ncbi:MULTISPECIES: DsbA family protein [Hyphobacterium]|uniref:2-hydroxychromene-2-carboxylate isomerase n=1 Tax=Hyphobacterium vulgare TaxID=1736751 RepID=A0ABV7A0T0_9PROT